MFNYIAQKNIEKWLNDFYCIYMAYSSRYGEMMATLAASKNEITIWMQQDKTLNTP
jgi:hypothetical protein